MHTLVRRGVLALCVVFAPACSATTPPEKNAPALVRAPPPALISAPQHCAHGESRPSREGFFDEVLFAAASRRTPRFDDYTAGSYHVDKLDLVQGLPVRAALCGVRLRAALVVGPLGPLWAYYVAVLVDEGATVRINTLVMPHARITGKGTGVVSPEEAALFLRTIQNASLVHPGIPATAADEFSYRLLLALYDQGKPTYFSAAFWEFGGGPGVEPLLNRVNAMLNATTTQTYRHGDHVE
jgi:hypothetical protein